MFDAPRSECGERRTNLSLANLLRLADGLRRRPRGFGSGLAVGGRPSFPRELRYVALSFSLVVPDPVSRSGWRELYKDADASHRRVLLRGNPSLPPRRLAIIQVNPSVAGAADIAGQRDRTTDRVEHWAERQAPIQFGEVAYLNLFTYRAKKMMDLGIVLEQPDGYSLATAGADQAISRWVPTAGVVVAAWGDMRELRRHADRWIDRRVSEMRTLLQGIDLFCVGRPLKSGQPEHSRRWNFGDLALRAWP